MLKHAQAAQVIIFHGDDEVFCLKKANRQPTRRKRNMVAIVSDCYPIININMLDRTKTNKIRRKNAASSIIFLASFVMAF
jgi:hypothetical protein